MITNLMVRRAVKALISQYKEGTHTGSWKSCPLCVIFGADWDVSLDTACLNCPNSAFYQESSLPDRLRRPCIRRTALFPILSWEDVEDGEELEPEPILVKFWKRVLAVLPNGYKTEFIMTDKLKSAIFNIAKQMQDESDKHENEVRSTETH